ncbi:MarR family winged helix-turn-helix transcriptional regulator [Geomonas oryzae]|uniref:MarR family winged helix-turn-helix transcriptional regulator n=1 Tax=Geomonas oryzae TaxID=2364273 RepID=UPI00100BCB6C|nr:MarR family transcriptional regulator [Geomonas oryzae]
MDKNLCYKINRLARMLMAKVNEQTKPHGVTQGQLPVLCCLDDEGGQTQAELCKNIQVEQPTMANTLSRMERDGLIYRVACDQDRRQSKIFLSEKTLPTVELLQRKSDEVVDLMTGDMSEAEVAEFKRLVDIAMRSLDR